MTDIYNLSTEKLRKYLTEIGEKPSKADIILPCLYKDFGKLSELPLKQSLIDRLEADFFAGGLTCEKKLESDTADKYLFKLYDENFIETVLMKHEYGCNICVSTQVGCNMGCAFCRSGRLKKVRNLTAAEITEQLIYVIKESGAEISGIAIMGIGEPLDNYDNVMDFIETAMYQKGFDIGPRHITLSTCGIVPKVYALSESIYPVNLAVSLHAPNDELRDRIMPINKKYPLSVLMPAVKHYSEAKKRRITLEYVMLKGVNDSTEHAKQLSELIGGSRCYVNIIRYNGSENDCFKCSDFDTIMRFYDVLKKNKIGVTMRRELGASVNAACGQLRADYNKG
ncbi:MAG: 23S rRNA (adenine(2503)-C(2))-methyltransferase RlmN [Ruminiclostridium sp.]